MDIQFVKSVINEELTQAEIRILQRLTGAEEAPVANSLLHKKPLPENENYKKALELYLADGNHSSVARSLGVSINAAKKYFNWLVKYGYLPIEDADLSDAELKVVECIFERGMSLRETAQELDCSVTNVVYRRDSALRKGYQPGSNN